MTDESMRQGTIAIAWTPDGLLGRVSLGGEQWAAVEWSEKRQQWCVEDAAGQCLRHVGSIKGAAASKEEAAALAEAMIRDGRMPTPAEAYAAQGALSRYAREKRARQPAQIRKREERNERLRRYGELSSKEWDARAEDEAAPPLYEALAEAFDFADAELWKSNSFAALRPRLVIHVRVVVAKLESDLAREQDRSPNPFCGLGASAERRRQAAAIRKAATSAAISRIEAKLARAQEILAHLISIEAGERPR